MKSIVTIVAFSLLSTVVFCQSSAQSQTTKQSTNKQDAAKTTTVTNTNKQSSTDRVGNPNTNGKTWYYCQVCGQKFTAAGKCPTDGTTLVAKMIK